MITNDPHDPAAQRWVTPRLTAISSGANAQGKTAVMSGEGAYESGTMFAPS
ncbi:MAG: hypothetical protein KDC23_02075 [Actinobacteria bacterium]|nr:hypothetical protein [Actinomycetota bacterium]